MPAATATHGITSFLALGVPPPVAASGLTTVTCQRLVRRICSICRQPADPPAPQTLALHGIGAEEAQTLSFFKGKGCPTCNTIGYRGRRAVFETLPASVEVRAAIEQGRGVDDVERAALETGMISVRERCLALVREGATSFDEFARLRL